MNELKRLQNIISEKSQLTNELRILKSKNIPIELYVEEATIIMNKIKDVDNKLITPRKYKDIFLNEPTPCKINVCDAGWGLSDTDYQYLNDLLSKKQSSGLSIAKRSRLKIVTNYRDNYTHYLFDVGVIVLYPYNSDQGLKVSTTNIYNYFDNYKIDMDIFIDSKLITIRNQFQQRVGYLNKYTLRIYEDEKLESD